MAVRLKTAVKRNFTNALLPVSITDWAGNKYPDCEANVQELYWHRSPFPRILNRWINKKPILLNELIKMIIWGKHSIKKLKAPLSDG